VRRLRRSRRLLRNARCRADSLRSHPSFYLWRSRAFHLTWVTGVPLYLGGLISDKVVLAATFWISFFTQASVDTDNHLTVNNGEK
jgi:hypothetical protein